ncbi:MAG TPA: twin-arginine translocase TatA/TatE family subunit, partial [Acidimicrobiia bacterium]
MRISGQEWLIVLLIVLLIFGARKLPELARSLGSSAKEFRKGIEEGARDDEDDPES